MLFTYDPYRSEGEKLSEWKFMAVKNVIDKGDYVAYNSTNPSRDDCNKCVDAQLDLAGERSSNYWPSAYQLYSESPRSLRVSTESKIRGVDAIHKSLEQGKPIKVGINYADNYFAPDNEKTDRTTEHFVTIVGRGVDIKGREYFSFFENATGLGATGTDISYNRLYLQQDGTLTGKSRWTSSKFTVTQVRPNESETPKLKGNL